MKILVVGSGGREHALAWKFSQSTIVKSVFVTPGNDGIKACGFLNDGIQLTSEGLFSEEDLIRLRNEKTLVVIGSEAYLEKGMANQLRKAQVLVVGPQKEAAQLESSKVFSKSFMKEFQIPTSDFYHFTEKKKAVEFIEQNLWKDGSVVKMDSLAAGKGVVVCSTKEESINAVDFFFSGGAGFTENSKLLIEQKVTGKEVSAFALCDGDHFKILGYASDFKRLYDGHQGPNTGGMGAVTPVTWLTESLKSKINKEVFEKTLLGMKKQGTPFQGILFAGLMIDGEEISVLEFNVRMGDPETQALVMSSTLDWGQEFLAAAQGELKNENSSSQNLFALHKVFASPGYPGTEPGQSIQLGISVQKNMEQFLELEKEFQGKIFFAGIANRNSKWVTSGGRVFGLSLEGGDPQKLLQQMDAWTEKVRFEGAQYRTDIRW